MDFLTDQIVDKGVALMSRPMPRRGFLGWAIKSAVALSLAAGGAGSLFDKRAAAEGCCVYESCNNCPTGICTSQCCPPGYLPSLQGTCCLGTKLMGCWLCQSMTGNCGCEVWTGDAC